MPPAAANRIAGFGFKPRRKTSVGASQRLLFIENRPAPFTLTAICKLTFSIETRIIINKKKDLPSARRKIYHQQEGGLFINKKEDLPPTDSQESFRGRGDDSGRTRKRERSPCDEEVQERPQKRRKEDRPLWQEEMAVFFRVLEDPNIWTFLAVDSCMRISDKYLLAMVFVYFIRAGLQTEEYHKNFFPALFLANQMEEEVGFRREIYQWAFGYTWMQKRQQILHHRNLLLLRIGFRALVDQDTCEQVMAVDPLH
ncbi:speedy protein 1-A-like [Eleutherodactylus coqui]|uniref:speedy protein 1-A-like n=1 Tax=Eleutherodactylus coqui TaxID=57060 RepID=UPI003461FFB1